MKKLLSIVAIAGLMVMNINAQSTLSASITTSTNWGVAAQETYATGGIPTYSAIGTNIVDGGCLVQSLTFVNASSGNVTIGLFDAPYRNLNIGFCSTNGTALRTNIYTTNSIAWVAPPTFTTNWGVLVFTQALANVTKITTNYSGVTTTNTFTNALVSGAWVNLNPTNNFRRAFIISVPGNSTVTPNLGAGLLFGHGITMTNGAIVSPASAATNITVIVNYDPSL